MIKVKFTKQFAGYKAGDKATFVRSRSIALVLGGVAELVHKRDAKWLERYTQAKTS